MTEATTTLGFVMLFGLLVWALEGGERISHCGGW